ncbi:MAG: hypothetical protein UH850_12530 [Paludibacteraceae bacterium]|nr:hypothetical protein [Paludibacteraceae bacterium]
MFAIVSFHVNLIPWRLMNFASVLKEEDISSTITFVGERQLVVSCIPITFSMCVEI